MRQEMVKLLNKLCPKYTNNTDPLLFGYKFWTEAEKLAKKQRVDALSLCLSAAHKDPEDSGIILSGDRLRLELSVSKPILAFDNELFIAKIIETFPEIDRHVLRELATASVVDTNPRKTYKIVEI